MKACVPLTAGLRLVDRRSFPDDKQRRLPPLFHEELMGLLALVGLGTALGPVVFEIGPATESLLNGIELIVLTLFIIEFVLQWRNAVDRRSWLRSPWRIVDLLAIGGPLVSLLPQASNTFRGALAFRLLRVGRAVAFGARAGAVAVQRQRRFETHSTTGDAVLTVVRPDAQAMAHRASWSEYLAWPEERSPAWYHAASASRDTFVQMAETAGISEQALGI
jgi:Ion transport protein